MGKSVANLKSSFTNHTIQNKYGFIQRNLFFEDPFFSNVWEDFEALKKEIWSEHRSLLSDPDFWPRSRLSSFPSRRWFFPDNFLDEDFKLLPQLKDEILKVTDNDNKFEVSLDTHGFQPEDLQIKIKDNVINIEAKHEEKNSEDNSKSYVSRHLSRSYTLPKGCKAEKVTSNLSSDGVLMVSAPKNQNALKNSRTVPSEMKK